MAAIFRGRPALLWLLGPPVVFLAALPFVNSPYLLGPWLLAAALLTPLFILLAARKDPVFRDEPDVQPQAEFGRGDGS
jgi:hypothetical protein